MSETSSESKTGEWLRFIGIMVLSGIVAYFTAINTIQTRLSVVEVRVDRIGQDISEIKADLRQLLRQTQ